MLVTKNVIVHYHDRKKSLTLLRISTALPKDKFREGEVVNLTIKKIKK